MSSVHAIRCSVSVIMPVYRQAAFLPRALASLFDQTLQDWELLLIDDGSPLGAHGEDLTQLAAEPWLHDARVRYQRLPHNVGLGAVLNVGLQLAQAPLIATLPADDIWYREHLAGLVELLENDDTAVMATSGVVHHYNRRSTGRIEGEAWQLVQVAWRRTALRWIERRELVTDDLDRLYWLKLQHLGRTLHSGQISCEWVDHPEQHHKHIREPRGGINAYRQYYGVREPLRFHSSVGNLIDEPALLAEFECRQPVRALPRSPHTSPLRIVLAGELAYNSERVLALRAAGHELYGLWMRKPHWYNGVGGCISEAVQELDPLHWREQLQQLAPDVIYAQLNWQAVPFAWQVLQDNPGLPFVWHFKEGPFICLEQGSWPQLYELYARADGRIFCSPELADWFALQGLAEHDRQHGPVPQLILDGDLPPAAWFTGQPATRLSTGDGVLHTVVPGRPIGLHPHTVAALGQAGIHLHFYGDFTHGQWRDWINKALQLAPGSLHLHAHTDQRRWVAEFSRYDAGWLHCFTSHNGGDLRRADWDDLNYPARLATYAAAGLPMIQRSNPGCVVASEHLLRRLRIGVLYRDIDDLAQQLHDAPHMQQLREHVWQTRSHFCFDSHIGDLTALLHAAIEHHRTRAAIRRYSSQCA